MRTLEGGQDGTAAILRYCVRHSLHHGRRLAAAAHKGLRDRQCSRAGRAAALCVPGNMHIVLILTSVILTFSTCQGSSHRYQKWSPSSNATMTLLHLACLLMCSRLHCLMLYALMHTAHAAQLAAS